MKISDGIRREYGQQDLSEHDLDRDPVVQFMYWLNEAIEAKILDTNAMILSTVDANGYPDSRVVLLKECNEQGFIFYTNYHSPKAMQAEINGAALLFYWREMTRQVRVKGRVTRITHEESCDYFATRPRNSQIGAVISDQSKAIDSRIELETKFTLAEKNFQGKEIPCPLHWGGYLVTPFEMEFFQGRDNRLHDRFKYSQSNGQWLIERLSP